jgi:hypothetical protein
LARPRAASFAAAAVSDTCDAASLAFFVFISDTVDLLLMISSQSLPVTGDLNPFREMGPQTQPDTGPELTGA